MNLETLNMDIGEAALEKLGSAESFEASELEDMIRPCQRGLPLIASPVHADAAEPSTTSWQ